MLRVMKWAEMGGVVVGLFWMLCLGIAFARRQSRLALAAKLTAQQRSLLGLPKTGPLASALVGGTKLDVGPPILRRCDGFDGSQVRSRSGHYSCRIPAEAGGLEASQSALDWIRTECGPLQRLAG